MLSSIFGTTPLHTRLNTASDATTTTWKQNFPSFIPFFCQTVEKELIAEASKTRQRFYDVRITRLNKEGDAWRNLLLSYTRVPGFVNNEENCEIRKTLKEYFTTQTIPLECTDEVEYSNNGEVECFLRIRWDNPVPEPEKETSPNGEGGEGITNLLDASASSEQDDDPKDPDYVPPSESEDDE